MGFERVVHFVLPVYVLAGYLSAYRMAKQTVQDRDSSIRPSSFARWGAMFMVVVMAVAAFTACYEEWSALSSFAELFGILIGISMNLFFFYASCTTLLTKKSTGLSMDAQ